MFNNLTIKIELISCSINIVTLLFDQKILRDPDGLSASFTRLSRRANRHGVYDVEKCELDPRAFLTSLPEEALAILRDG